MWRKVNALIRFFYKINPDTISIDERCKLECELRYLSSIGVINVELK